MNFMNFAENSNFELDLKIKKVIFRVNSVIFKILEKNPECILNMNFMNFAENSKLELDLKIEQIILRVNLGIF